MLGAGHGGAEAIALGSMLAINAAVLYAISSGRLELALPPEAQAAVTEQLQSLGGEPWYLLILGAVERLFALAIHLALSLLVMQRFVRGRIRWLAAAVGWHAMTNAVAVVALPTWGPYVTEGLIGILALISLGIVAALRNAEPAQVAEGHGAEIMPLTLVRRESTAEEIESSRYA
jgi:uncharacterized membrane protein YhfC